MRMAHKCPQKGSPPRVRGTVAAESMLRELLVGITPACTGNGLPEQGKLYLPRPEHDGANHLDPRSRQPPALDHYTLDHDGAALNRWTTTGPQFIEHTRRSGPNPRPQTMTPQRIEPEHREHLLYLPVQRPERDPVTPIALSKNPEPERYPFVDAFAKHLDNVRINVQ